MHKCDLLYYRCFVLSNRAIDNWTCYYEECREAIQARERSRSIGDCDLISKVDCAHILAAKAKPNQKARSFTSLCSLVLQTVPFPSDVLAAFERHVKDDELDKIIHRVSDHSFVVREGPSSSSGNSLGILHVRVDKKKHFYCTCSKFKRMTSLCGATTAPKVSRRCPHIYLCLWSILSDDKLKKEFTLDEKPALGT